jgi:hypothetical protein
MLGTLLVPEYPFRRGGDSGLLHKFSPFGQIAGVYLHGDLVFFAVTFGMPVTRNALSARLYVVNDLVIAIGPDAFRNLIESKCSPEPPGNIVISA